MTTPNHIAGGLFFTGFWASFWHVNIFSEPVLIGATVVASLLPDADHTKSPLGLALYPIAYVINRKFGHRTITHSLLFLVLGTFLIYALANIFKLSNSYISSLTLIFFFAVLSHYILDMVTVQGIPLFYPFFKNPCVIPGNPDYRFNSGAIRPELTAFILFIGMNFLCYDLYANGFWTQFNRAIGQIPSINDEFKNTPNYILVDYDFTQDGKQHVGRGTALYATYKELGLLTKDGIYYLKEDIPNQDINKLKPTRTNIPFKIEKLQLLNVSIDSVKSAIKDKYLTGTIQSDNPFYYDNSGIVTRTNDLKLKDVKNPILYIIADTSKLADYQAQLKAKQFALSKKNTAKADNKYYKVQEEIAELKYQLSNLPADDIANRTVIENRLIKLNATFQNMTLPVVTPVDNTLILSEIAELQIKIQQLQRYKQIFNVSLSYPVLSEDLTKMFYEK